MLHPRYEFNASLGDEQLLKHSTIFTILFRIQDLDAVESAFGNDTVREVFFEKQILKTMWPILRQLILDGMSKLGLPAIPLPWIID